MESLVNCFIRHLFLSQTVKNVENRSFGKVMDKSRVSCFVVLFFRSTSKSRPNNIRGGKNVRPYVRPSVRPQKVSSI